MITLEATTPTREVFRKLFTHVEGGAGCVCTHKDRFAFHHF